MSDTIISVENVGKSYFIGHEKQRGYASIGDIIYQKARGISRGLIDTFRGKQLISGNEIEEFWALKDVNFEVKQGDAIGIIGRNGAGKSTLLKVLSRITEPTRGKITLKGRIASLLEVGTGFHPELSGRENIYLNGAILGMSRAEIRQKFDEIVDFSGVEKFLDTPVKRYSSGMYVRLAFAVAAHLEPEILIVDEVLAVGDAEFQKKCLGKMKDVSEHGGRTVLFVSHNISAVKQLCNRALLMQNGRVMFDSGVQNAINEYLKFNSSRETYKNENNNALPSQILELSSSKKEYTYEEDISVTVTLKNNSNERGLRCNIVFFDTLDQLLFVEMLEVPPASGITTHKLTIPGGKLAPISLRISATMDIPNIKVVDIMKEFLMIEIIDLDVKIKQFGDSNVGIILSEGRWEKIN
ncbi:MAG: ABC transporter ATP-binding protein [Ferruginibacter sp.]